MSDLHAALVAAVNARLETARAAQEESWIHEYSGETGHCVMPADAPSTREYIVRANPYPTAYYNAEHIAANDPPTVIRACEADLERLGEHRPCDCGDDDMPVGHCQMCRVVACAEVRRIARVYSVDISEEDRNG